MKIRTLLLMVRVKCVLEIYWKSC